MHIIRSMYYAQKKGVCEYLTKTVSIKASRRHRRAHITETTRG